MDNRNVQRQLLLPRQEMDKLKNNIKTTWYLNDNPIFDNTAISKDG
jgi:hypothetical protein